MAKSFLICVLMLLHSALACELECLRSCSQNCVATCRCPNTATCEATCQIHALPVSCPSLCLSQASAVDRRLLPKPQSVSSSGPFSPQPSFSEDFEMTKMERCKATCQTFCEINEKPGLCPGMCELLFCFQSMESYVPMATPAVRSGAETTVLLSMLCAAVTCIVCMARRAKAASLQKEVIE